MKRRGLLTFAKQQVEPWFRDEFRDSAVVVNRLTKEDKVARHNGICNHTSSCIDAIPELWNE
jgi:hypothetical protein